jgi:hypothetical protein
MAAIERLAVVGEALTRMRRSPVLYPPGGGLPCAPTDVRPALLMLRDAVDVLTAPGQLRGSFSAEDCAVQRPTPEQTGQLERAGAELAMRLAQNTPHTTAGAPAPATSPAVESPPTSALADADQQQGAARSSADRENERRTKVTRALACLLTIGPNATRIAKEIGVPRGTLLGWPAFRERYNQMKTNIEAAKSGRRRGRRAGDRDFEVDED